MRCTKNGGGTVTVNVGVIGGSGFYAPDVLGDTREFRQDTPFGTVSLTRTQLAAGHSFLFVPRHGSEHAVPPHLVNYRAIIWAMWQSGVSKLLSTSAVGSLNPSMKPGDIVLAEQFLDFTKNRPSTFCDGGEFGVIHQDMTSPYCASMRQLLRRTAQSQAVQLEDGACYACFEGPRYESAAEIRAIRVLGADIVGMTNVPEVVLAREMGLCYSTICVITNWAAGIGRSKLSHDEVVFVVNQSTEKITRLLQKTIPMLDAMPDCECGPVRERMGSHVRSLS